MLAHKYVLLVLDWSAWLAAGLAAGLVSSVVDTLDSLIATVSLSGVIAELKQSRRVSYRAPRLD